MPMVALGWKTPDRVHVCLDSTAPVVSSHHQKLVVIDDCLAFCGGLDLTIRRWDTADHASCCPARVDPSGAAYGPYHDVEMIVDGEAARALAEIARSRWCAASTEAPAPIEDACDEATPWPDAVRPDFRNVTVGIARTRPESFAKPGVNEVETLYLEAIAQADRTLYIENQFLHCTTIANALAERAAQRPELEIVIVSNQTSGGWLEERTMGMGRRRFISILNESAGADRIRVLRSMVSDGDASQEVHIHAKLQIVDDRLLRIGSSNLNQRSMGLDTECDIAIEAETEEERARVAELRDGLIGHHFGMSADALKKAIARHGSVIAAIDAAGGGANRLEPIDPAYPAPILDEDFEVSIANAADPRTPPTHAALSAALEIRRPNKRSRGVPIRLIVLAVIASALVALWYFTPLSEIADVETLEPYFQQIADSGWAPLAIPLVFAVTSLIFFPVTILIALTGMTLGPITGLLSASAVCLGSAALGFGAGALMGEKGLRRIMGRRLNRLSQSAAEKGVVSMVGLRLLPVAPFTAINLIAGASHVRFSDFMIGTVLGMLPGIVLMTALGDRLRQVWHNPSVENTVLLGLLALAWFGAAIGLQYLVSKYRKRR
jgi:uncharacterized membrane protein YdjX (TVP38/TMEM64 family)